MEVLGVNLKELELKIKENPQNFAQFDKDKNITQSGFRRSPKIFNQFSDGYFVVDYFEMGIKKMPSYQTELYYFKYLDKITETEEKTYPILIKLLFNTRKRILCFYSKQKVTNELADALIMKLMRPHHIQFKYSPINYTFKRDQLDDFVNALGIEDYTAISIWDKDNKALIENPKTITETDKFISFLNEHYKGNWHHITVKFSDLDILLRINNKTQKFITFENNYVDDPHLVRAIDFIVGKIKETEDFSGKKQLFMDKFLDKDF